MKKAVRRNSLLAPEDRPFSAQWHVGIAYFTHCSERCNESVTHAYRVCDEPVYDESAYNEPAWTFPVRTQTP